MESAETKNCMISAIVPTIGRPDSLKRMLRSLCAQTCKVDEVIVADGSSDDETRRVVDDPHWRESGLVLRHVTVHPPNTVRQREIAIRASRGEMLLMLDDDVVLEPVCAERMLALLQSHPEVVGVTADFNNQAWSQPTRLWLWYLRYILRLPPGAWQGRVIGPLLRFGYNPVPASPQAMEWLGSGNSMVRRSAYERAGGFSDFFLHRCTINEDVDFGIKLARVGRILFCPDARMAHHHAPKGRVSATVAAEDDLFNRFFVLRRTLGLSVWRAFGLIGLFFVIESATGFLGCVQRFNFGGFFERLSGRVRALIRILLPVTR